MEYINTHTEQELLISELDRLRARIEGYEAPTKELLEDRRRQLEELFQKLRANHLKLVTMNAPETDDTSPDLYDPALFDEISDTYNSLVDKIFELMPR